jgi:hypothetical protein
MAMDEFCDQYSTETPKAIWATMGWRPIAVGRQYAIRL